MIDDSNLNRATEHQQLHAAYQRGELNSLLAAMTPAQQYQFCRAAVAQACAECARVVALMEQRYGDDRAAVAVAEARAWHDQGALPSAQIQRSFENFYNPFWLSYTDTSSDPRDCGQAAAYCTAQATAAAWRGDGATASAEALTVVDMLAQAAGADRADAGARARHWQLDVAWALLHDAAPPAWPTQPPLPSVGA